MYVNIYIFIHTVLYYLMSSEKRPVRLLPRRLPRTGSEEKKNLEKIM